ncbi:hypothetical protein P4V41_16585 [Fictibacillus nanhaiensis]|uniref:PD-(D/E)XK nuclease family protein n=1 Tax=Fictibacillus nanhaiensis TaxID=742169 RepID=UPI002E221E67|nr:hypothetical protein [Fictibacillus nanhaiensis]
MNQHFQIAVKTITDYHLESFLRCPYKFYYRHILPAKSSNVLWRQIVQGTINKIVQSYYQLPENLHTELSVLRLIQRYWDKLNVKNFESKFQYYLVLAKVTDHLLKYLTSEKSTYPRVFLYEKQKTFIKELETELSLTIDVAGWHEGSFTVTKYLLETDSEMSKMYNYLITVFAEKAFGKLPQKIEIINLMNGKKYSYTPSQEDVKEGLMYLDFMMDRLQQPNKYTKTEFETECTSCEFNQTCLHTTDKVNVSVNGILH